jgi:transcription antitermination protein NusB
VTHNKIFQGRIGRRQLARSLCVQALYQWHMAGHSASEVEAQFLADQDFQKADKRLFSQLLRGVTSRVEALDKLLIPHLDRTIGELDPVEISILRMGVFELSDSINTPYRVIINECIELGKQFGATDGYKYINSIMDQLAHQLRTIEMQSRRPAPDKRTGRT